MNPPDTALVVAAHGRRGLLEQDGVTRRFVSKGRGLRIVCGDRVSCELRPGSDELLATAVQPRRNELSRVHPRDGRREVLASNLTQVIVVCAPRPEADLFLLDRYLCAAELMSCTAVLLWNKCDVEPLPRGLASEFEPLGIRLVEVSARSGDRVPTLGELLANQTTAMVGQSGVGKSSLVNALVPAGGALVGALSAAGSTGTHTTTAVVMYQVGSEACGRLLDTPGQRDFLPAIDRQARIDRGFREMQPHIGTCRFADCAHIREPGCAIMRAVETGAISARRFESYQRLYTTIANARLRASR